MNDAAEPDVELIYIAARLEEAQELEKVLHEHGIRYEVRVEQYRSGILFASVRAGAFFYVPVPEAARSRAVLSGLGYRVQEPS
jgi:hypothetical protein